MNMEKVKNILTKVWSFLKTLLTIICIISVIFSLIISQNIIDIARICALLGIMAGCFFYDKLQEIHLELLEIHLTKLNLITLICDLIIQKNEEKELNKKEENIPNQ